MVDAQHADTLIELLVDQFGQGIQRLSFAHG